MTDLNDVREMYPQFKNVPDSQVVDELWNMHKDVYWQKGLDKAKFALSLGYNPPTQRMAEQSSMKALAENPPKYEGISKLERDTNGWLSRPYFVGGGATAGSIAGGALGGAAGGVGAVPGAGLGGYLGAAGGSAGFDALENAYRWFKDDSTPRPEPEGRFVGPMKRAMGEGNWDIGFSSILPEIGPMTRYGLGKLVGTMNPESRMLAENALSQGIGLGPTHYSQRGWPKGFARVFSVFPFTHKVYAKGQTRLLGELDERAAQLMNELAPTATTYDTSRTGVQEARRRLTKYDNISAALFNRFWRAVEGAGDPTIVPTLEIKRGIGKVYKRLRRETARTQEGKIITSPGDSGELLSFINDLADLPPMISFGEARGIEKKLNAQLRTIKGEGWDDMLDIKRGLERAKNNIDFSESNLPMEVRDDIMKKWKDALGFYTDSRKLWERPTAKKFGTVDRGLYGFEHGYFKPGGKNSDEIFSAVWNDKSIDALDDLKKIVGERQYKEGVQQYIRKAFDASVKRGQEGGLTTEQFSAKAFRQQLGLDTREGKQFLEKALGPDLARAWDDFLTVAERAADLGVGDPSTFATRRMIMHASSVVGGAPTMLGSMAFGYGHISIPGVVLSTILLRKGAKGLMNPSTLRSMTRLIDPKTPEKQAKMLAARLFKASIQDAADTSDRQGMSKWDFENQLRDVYNQGRDLISPALEEIKKY